MSVYNRSEKYLFINSSARNSVIVSEVTNILQIEDINKVYDFKLILLESNTEYILRCQSQLVQNTNKFTVLKWYIYTYIYYRVFTYAWW